MERRALLRNGAPIRSLALSLLVVLSACAKEARPPPGPPEKVTVAYSTIPITSLFLVAKEKGYFPAEGLEVVAQPHEFGKPALQSVLDGKADLATPADTPVMFAVVGGRKVAVLAEICTSTKATAIVARKDRGIVVPTDLRGKRIGVARRTTGEFFLDSFLVTRGIGHEEVALVDLRPGDMARAVASGEVDAVAVWQPALEDAVLALRENGITFFDATVYSDILCLVTTPEFLERRPEAARRMLRALLRAEAFIRESPEEARRLVARSISMDPALLERIWGTMDFRLTLDQGLLVSLEDQTRWAMRSGLTAGATRPNYLDVARPDVLLSIKPEAVGILH